MEQYGRYSHKGMEISLELIVFIVFYAAVLIPAFNNLIRFTGNCILLLLCMLVVFGNSIKCRKGLFIFFVFTSFESIIYTGVLLGGGLYDIIINYYGLMLTYMPIFIIIYLLEIGDTNSIIILTYCAIIMLAITALTTYVGLQTYENASRILAIESANELGYSDLYSSKNIGGFTSITCFTFMIPLLIMLLKRGSTYHKVLSRIFFAVIIIIMCLAIVAAEYTYLVILMLFGFCSVVLNKRVKLKKFIFILIAAVFLIYLLRFQIADFLYDFAGNMTSYGVSERYKLMASVLEGNPDKANDDYGRIQRYLASVQTFKKHPIIGGDLFGEGAGGHAFLLDTLADFGIVGGLSLFATLRWFYKNTYALFRESAFYTELFMTLVCYVICGALNSVSPFVPFALAPGVAVIVEEALRQRGK